MRLVEITPLNIIWALMGSRRLTPAYRSKTDKWRMTDDAWTNKRWTIGNQAYPWPLKWISWNTEPISRYFEIPIPNTEPTWKNTEYRYRRWIPTPTHDYVTHLLRDLQWLRLEVSARERINFKLAVLVYRLLHVIGPLSLSLSPPFLWHNNKQEMFQFRKSRDYAYSILGIRDWQNWPGSQGCKLQSPCLNSMKTVLPPCE